MMLTIGFSTPKEFKLFPWLIRKFEGVNYSHCFLVVNSESLGRDLVYEASIHNVTFNNYDLFKKKNHIPVKAFINIDRTKKKQLLQRCIDYLGKPYGYKTVLGMALARIFGIKPKWLDGEKSYICNELVGQILQEVIGLKMGDYEKRGPRYIHDRLKELGYVK